MCSLSFALDQSTFLFHFVLKESCGWLGSEGNGFMLSLICWQTLPCFRSLLSVAPGVSHPPSSTHAEESWKGWAGGPERSRTPLGLIGKDINTVNQGIQPAVASSSTSIPIPAYPGSGSFGFPAFGFPPFFSRLCPLSFRGAAAAHPGAVNNSSGRRGLQPGRCLCPSTAEPSRGRGSSSCCSHLRSNSLY